MPGFPFTTDPAAARSRYLILFAPSTKSPAFEMQMRLIGDEAEFSKRHGVSVVCILGAGRSRMGKRDLSPEDARSLRQQFHGPASDQFLAVLCEADGREVRRFDAPVQPEAMPFGTPEHRRERGA